MKPSSASAMRDIIMKDAQDSDFNMSDTIAGACLRSIDIPTGLSSNE